MAKLDVYKAMKLIDGIKLNGRPAEILDCSRDDLPQFFVDMGFKVGAEIGVRKGEFSEKFCQVGLNLFAVDPWQSYKEYEDKSQERFNFLYEHTKRVLSPYPQCTIIRKASMEAVEDFKDESLDFVYIDANHEFRYIAEDLYEWTKKVRKGGIVSGHDYDYYTMTGTRVINWHVANVVNTYIQTFGISNWYVIGRKDALPGENRSRWRSWMFVKQ